MATIIKTNQFFCTCCGGELALKFPISIKEMVTKGEGFEKLHSKCKQTYVEPRPDFETIAEVAQWWLENGDVGMSSKTMCQTMLGLFGSIDEPQDPADFGRCYKLLELIPEWKKELHKLRVLSRGWANLVDNWDELTEMYEHTEKPATEMYALMQTLIG